MRNFLTNERETLDEEDDSQCVKEKVESVNELVDFEHS